MVIGSKPAGGTVRGSRRALRVAFDRGLVAASAFASATFSLCVCPGSAWRVWQNTDVRLMTFNEIFDYLLRSCSSAASRRHCRGVSSITAGVTSGRDCAKTTSVIRKVSTLSAPFPYVTAIRTPPPEPAHSRATCCTHVPTPHRLRVALRCSAHASQRSRRATCARLPCLRCLLL
jgi:hypothetical protein